MTTTLTPQRTATPRVSADIKAADAVVDASVFAEESLNLDANEYLHFPWPSLDKAIGGIGPNRIVVMAAPPEGGKTSFTLSLLDELAEQGRRIVGAFLETPSDELIKQWACFRLGIDYEIVGTGAFLLQPDANDIRRAVKAEMSKMAEKFYRNVWIHGMESLTAASVDVLMRDAIEYEADLLMIDHLDHTDDSMGGSRGIVESNAILSAVKRGVRTARSQGSHLRVFGTSQMNNDSVRRGGLFGRCMPPIPSDVFMGAKKEQVSDLMLGLHRIRRPPMEGDKQIEDDIKAGRRPLSDLLLPNTIGIRIMKRRVGGGSNITIPLGFRHGRVVEPRSSNYTPRDRSPEEVFEPA